jgi:hypothetical protein
MSVAIHVVHKEFVPCRDAILVGAVELWVGLSKLSINDLCGMNRFGVYFIRLPVDIN